MLDAGVQKIDGKTYTLENPSMQRSKEVLKNRPLAVKDGYLTVDNDLYTLSEGIRDDMKVEEGQSQSLSKKQQVGKSQRLSTVNGFRWITS